LSDLRSPQDWDKFCSKLSKKGRNLIEMKGSSIEDEFTPEKVRGLFKMQTPWISVAPVPSNQSKEEVKICGERQ
jgi:hypothetical protein